MTSARRALRAVASAGLLAIMTGALVSVPVLAVANSTINGVITISGTSTPIAGVQVATSPASVTATTDSGGAYSLSVAAGTYDVLFTMSGYNNNFFGGAIAPAGGSITASQALVPIPANAAQDLFSRPDQSGIGTASDGNAWTRDTALFPNGTVDISSRRAFFQTVSAVTDLDVWMGIAYRDQEVTADVNAINVLPPVGTQHGGRLLARVQGADTWLLMALNPSDSTLTLWVDVAGNYAQIGSVAHGFATNAWYHAKLDAIGTNVYGKAWAVGSAEPAGWQVTAPQSAIQAAGVGGLRTGGADAYFMNYMETPVTQISGRVTDAGTSAAIAGATVSLNTGASTTTDGSGNYVIGGLAAGSYTVSAVAPSHNSASTTAAVTLGVSAFGADLALTSIPNPVSIAISGKPVVGDFTGDGNSDLAMYDTSGISVAQSTGADLSGPGSGRWATFPFYGSKATLAGDVTGDGKADMIAVNAGQTFILPSTGTAFGPAQVWATVPFYGTRGTFLADVNADAKADLVAINDTSSWVMLSNGTTFGAPTPWSSVPFYGTKTTTIGDVNGDGKADLIAVNAGNSWIMTSTGTNFAAPAAWSALPFYGTVTTTVADVNGDGKKDLVAVNAGNQWVMISTGTGFNAPAPLSGTPFYGQLATLPGDVNGDLRADLIAINNSSVWIARSTGSAFAFPQRWL
jgi:carboxypeptidase family protein/VCBS repeat protein